MTSLRISRIRYNRRLDRLDAWATDASLDPASDLYNGDADNAWHQAWQDALRFPPMTLRSLARIRLERKLRRILRALSFRTTTAPAGLVAAVTLSDPNELPF